MKTLTLAIFLAVFLVAIPQAANAQATYTYTFTATATPAGDRNPATPALDVDEDDTVTVTLTLSGLPTSNLARVRAASLSFEGTATQGQDYTGPMQSGEVWWPGIDLGRNDGLVHTETYTITADNTAEGDETITLAVPIVRIVNGAGSYATTSTAITITIRANDANNRYVAPVVTPDPVTPPATRPERVMGLATVANQAVERLGAGIIRGRLARGGPGGQAPARTLAAADAPAIADSGPWAANPRARTAGPDSGGAMTMAEALNGGAFSLSSVNDTLAIWGAGGYNSLDGTVGGTTGNASAYDGDSAAFHIGAESWIRDSVLAGVTVGYTVGDIDWTAGAVSGKIRSAMTSVHPYWAKWINDATSLWLTVGYGSSNVTYAEGDATASPTLNTMTASGGVTSRSALFESGGDVALHINAAWVASDLGGATLSNGNELPGAHSTAVRFGSEWEFGWTVDTGEGELRLFATAGARKDYKDAKDDIAYDLGGGFQWTDGRGLNISVEGSRQLDGGARYNENRVLGRMSVDTVWHGFGIAPFTRLAMGESGDRTLAGGINIQTARRLTLTLETALSDSDNADYRNLLSGEWRF